jgi:ubiquinone/menaquinone biosynthesis C-methylase UbiE
LGYSRGIVLRTLEPEVMDTPDEAHAYDQMDHAEPNRAFVTRVVELGARGNLLDLGCGPGHLPLLLCEAIDDLTVLGVDLAGSMIEIAEAHRQKSPHRDRVRYEIADAKDLFAHADDSFDAVVSNTLLHHIPEPAGFLRECARLVRPGGALLIRDLFRPPTPARADELVELHAGACTPVQKDLFRASLHAALTPGELRVLADQVGLGDARLVVDTDRHMSLQRAAA